MSTSEAQSYISLLKDNESSVKLSALKEIAQVIDHSWPVVASELITLEILYEDPSFEDQELAAFVASKVYYYLGRFDLAIKYALASGKYFELDTDQPDLFVETIISKSLEKYIELRKDLYNKEDSIQETEKNESTKNITNEDSLLNTQLKEVFVKIVNKCIESGEYNVALGISIDCCEVEFIELIFLKVINALGCEFAHKLLSYAIQSTQISLRSEEFGEKVWPLLFKIAINMRTPDILSAEKIAFITDDADKFLDIFLKLSEKDVNDPEFEAVDYQVAFDITSYASENVKKELICKINNLYRDEREENIIYILKGTPTVHFTKFALNKNRSIDLSILKKAKSHLDGKYSVFHNAVALSNSFLHCGTGDDKFVRDNLSWLGKAKHWAKFSATASLGVLHRYDVKNAEKLLQPYLPSNKNPSRFIKAGSLYGLGIIYAGNPGKERISSMLNDIIENQMDKVQSDDASQILVHGACLGLGITTMGCNDSNFKDILQQIASIDIATCSEPALYALGLNHLGHGNKESIDFLLNLAATSTHNNVIQSIGIALALEMFESKGKFNDVIFGTMKQSENTFLRYGTPHAIGMSYIGTGSNLAIESLLEIAVTDSDDNIRRAAATNIGFVLCKDHTQVPKILGLLARSHDPHVRCGTALALGISSAGKNYMPAVEMLLTLSKDPVDFVKQHTFIALAMILIQQTEKSNPKVKEVNELFDTIISTRRAETLTKFGACLGQGIMNACGRNGTIQLENPEFGTINSMTAVGLLMFTQFWSWFPLAHFLNLAFTPSNIIAVTSPGFEAPDIYLQSHTREGVFDYPEIAKEEANVKKVKAKSAVLSTSKFGKTKNKLQQIIQKREEIKNEIKEENKAKNEKKEKAKLEASKANEKTEAANIGKSVFSQQPIKLENFSRVLPNQSKYVSFAKNNDRYEPVRKFKGYPGVVVVKDLKSEMPKQKSLSSIVVEIEAPKKIIMIDPSVLDASKFEELQETYDQVPI